MTTSEIEPHPGGGDADDFDRTASMFTEGAPDVAIGGADIVRSTIVPLSDVEDDAPAPGLHWHVTAIPTLRGESSGVALLGDLFISEDGWFIGVTGAMSIMFRNAADAPDSGDFEAINAVGHRLGPWISNVLYDVIRMRANQMIASTEGCEVDLPRLTPRTHITRIEHAESGADV